MVRYSENDPSHRPKRVSSRDDSDPLESIYNRVNSRVDSDLDLTTDDHGIKQSKRSQPGEELCLSAIVDEMIKKAPQCSQLKMHEDSCCLTAEASLKANVAIADGRGGIASVISHACKLSKWGARRCEWLCDALKYREELDCGAEAALFQMMLKYSRECSSQQVSVHRVQVILRSSKQETNAWAKLFSKVDRESYDQWIHPSGMVVYHECIGIHTIATGLKVFDPANKFWFLPSINDSDAGAVLSWMVQDLDHDTTNQMQFDGYTIPTNRWFTTMSSLNSSLVMSVVPSSNDIHVVDPPLFRSLKKQLNIYISGVANNNDNPSPGLGVARSLRTMCDSNSSIDINLIAVDFSLESAGLGDSVFHNRIILPDWDHYDPDQHAQNVIELVSSSPSSNTYSLYISCLDVETTLLARELPKYFRNQPELQDRILIPCFTALNQTRKPHIHAGSELGFKISEFLEVPEERNDDPTVQAWCVSKGYPIMVKGRSYDAMIATSWAKVRESLTTLQNLWGSSSTFLQRSVIGTEGSLTFSAYNGQLLAAALMLKCQVTPSRKVWQAQIKPVPDDLLEKLKQTVSKLNWTGGGEIEFIEKVDGTRYLIDWNPRFPAWIYGATISTNVNLPLALIGAAAWKSFEIDIVSAGQPERLACHQIITPLSSGIFMRTIIEQCYSGVQPSVLAGPEDSAVLNMTTGVASKGSGTSRPHPSRNTGAAKYLKPPKSEHTTQVSQMIDNQVLPISLPSTDWLKQLTETNSKLNTPLIVFDPKSMSSTINTIRETISSALENVDHPNSKHCSFDLALSIKTNPTMKALTTGLNNGLLAEAISSSEMKAALAAGYSSEQIILNGPGKWHDHNRDLSLAPINILAVIADSVTELEQLVQKVAAGEPLNPDDDHGDVSISSVKYIGARIAVPGAGSRFGIDMGEPGISERVANALQRLPADQKTAFHFHLAPSTLGIPGWTGAAKAAISLAAAIDKISGRTCSMFDFGGGWAAQTFDKSNALEPLTQIFNDAMEQLPGLERIIFEPGKSIVQDTSVMITRVLSIRESTTQMRKSQTDDDQKDEGRAIVIDTAITELPDIRSHSHPFAWLNQRSQKKMTWDPIVTSSGRDTIYGRTCMEHDILAKSTELPQDLKVGDFIAIGAIGAYDISMGCNFGTASQHHLSIHDLQ